MIPQVVPMLEYDSEEHIEQIQEFVPQGTLHIHFLSSTFREDVTLFRDFKYN